MIENLIAEAKRREVLDPGRGADWVFFHVMCQADRDEMDRWLVSIKHPLAYEAGTQEQRFRQLVAEEERS